MIFINFFIFSASSIMGFCSKGEGCEKHCWYHSICSSYSTVHTAGVTQDNYGIYTEL